MRKRIAVCACGEPLVWTFVFRGKEWYCVECGRAYGMFGCDMADPTKELTGRQTKLADEFDKIAAPIIPPGAILPGCEQCRLDTDHFAHATDEETRASEAALEALNARRTMTRV